MSETKTPLPFNCPLCGRSFLFMRSGRGDHHVCPRDGEFVLSFGGLRHVSEVEIDGRPKTLAHD
jgi:hypothetical protein